MVTTTLEKGIQSLIISILTPPHFSKWAYRKRSISNQVCSYLWSRWANYRVCCAVHEIHHSIFARPTQCTRFAETWQFRAHFTVASDICNHLLCYSNPPAE